MKLMILDGNSVINRAFYGVRPLTTRDGLYTNAIYGFLNILEKERSEEKPDALCVAFDLHAPTFRHLRYDGYKATRHPMPEELAMQMPVMKQVLAAMNIPIYACEGWEADDVLGTVGRLCRGGRVGLRYPDGRPRQPAARRRARLRAPGAHAGRADADGALYAGRLPRGIRAGARSASSI